MLRKIGANLAFVVILGYMIIRRQGELSMWIPVGIAVLWAVGLLIQLYQHRGGVKAFFQGFPRTLFTGAGVRPWVERPTADRVTLVLSVILSAGVALTSAAGIYLYLAEGITGDDRVDTALTIQIALFLLLILFRRRWRYIGKARKTLIR